ncbi:MAG: DUF2589 domain-containing protein [Clostridium sp.]|nr:DUF2589 domain-containing protein [Clostridium sp.]
MGTNDNENNIVEQALANIDTAKAQFTNSTPEPVLEERNTPLPQSAADVKETADTSNNSSSQTSNESSDKSNIAQNFVGLPIESLICAPIIAAAKGQQELTAIYVDTVKSLAYQKDGTSTNKLDFTMDRPITKSDGSVSTQKFNISAPLLSLVPVPAFTMDELTVDFDMEVKTSDMSQSKTAADVASSLNYKSWYGLSANITGSVSSDSTHKRETDTSAIYKIHARAIQQPPSEGMAKLTALFSQMIEPIST